LLASVVGHETVLLDKVEHPGRRTTVARPCRPRSAVQYVLHGKVDLDSIGVPSDLNAIC
jgi:hypothetical protein